jgi:hypothetical protein
MSGAISPDSYPASPEFGFYGDWTAKASRSRRAASKWLFVRLERLRDPRRRYLWSQYTKRQIDLVSWSGDSDAVVENAFAYAGCVFSPGVDCTGLDLRGVPKALAESGTTLAGISMAGAKLRTTNWSKVDMTKIAWRMPTDSPPWWHQPD